MFQPLLLVADCGSSGSSEIKFQTLCVLSRNLEIYEGFSALEEVDKRPRPGNALEAIVCVWLLTLAEVGRQIGLRGRLARETKRNGVEMTMFFALGKRIVCSGNSSRSVWLSNVGKVDIYPQAVGSSRLRGETWIGIRCLVTSNPVQGYIQLKKRTPSKPWLLKKTQTKKVNEYLESQGSESDVPFITKQELQNRPEGLSEEFFSDFFRFKHALKRNVKSPVSIIDLLNHWKTKQESDYFLSALIDNNKNLKNPVLLNIENEQLIMNNLINFNMTHRIVKIATEPSSFHIKCNEQFLKQGLNLLYNQLQKNIDNKNNKENLLILDNMYKLFAAMVFWNIIPTSKEYSLLILSGFKINDKESVRRSKITYNEAKTLQYNLDESINQYIN